MAAPDRTVPHIGAGADVARGAVVEPGAIVESGAVISWGADVEKGAHVLKGARGDGGTIGHRPRGNLGDAGQRLEDGRLAQTAPADDRSRPAIDHCYTNCCYTKHRCAHRSPDHRRRASGQVGRDLRADRKRARALARGASRAPESLRQRRWPTCARPARACSIASKPCGSKAPPRSFASSVLEITEVR